MSEKPNVMRMAVTIDVYANIVNWLENSTSGELSDYFNFHNRREVLECKKFNLKQWKDYETHNLVRFLIAFDDTAEEVAFVLRWMS